MQEIPREERRTVGSRGRLCLVRCRALCVCEDVYVTVARSSSRRPNGRWRIRRPADFPPLFILPRQRPAEIVDEEEDGGKANKDAEQKEDLSGTNGAVEGAGEEAAPADSEQAEGVPRPSEEPVAPARGTGGTDEENGEELDQVHAEPPEAVEEEVKSQGAGSAQGEVLVCSCVNVCAGHTPMHFGSCPST